MSYEVDVKLEQQASKSKFLRMSLLFSSLLTIVIVSDVLMITLTKENYLPFLIISIVISVLFAWFAIFFFTLIYSEINAKYRYFKGYDSGIKPTDEVIFLRKNDEICLTNGLYVYPLHVKYVSTLKEETKTIYTFAENLNFENGDKLTIETYQRILIKAEKHS